MKRISCIILMLISFLFLTKFNVEASSKNQVYFDKDVKGVGDVVITTKTDVDGPLFQNAVYSKLGTLNRACTFNIVFSDYQGKIIRCFDEDKRIIIEIPAIYISPEREFKLVKCIDDIPIFIDDLDANAMTFTVLMNRPGSYMLCYEDKEMPDIISR